MIKLATLFSVFSTLVMAHEAPTGWFYPNACCSNLDCREVVSPEKVRELWDGYHVPSGEIIAYSDRRVLDSPDGRYHLCTINGEATTRTRCLFVPPKGY